MDVIERIKKEAGISTDSEILARYRKLVRAIQEEAIRLSGSSTSAPDVNLPIRLSRTQMALLMVEDPWVLWGKASAILKSPKALGAKLYGRPIELTPDGVDILNSVQNLV